MTGIGVVRVDHVQITVPRALEAAAIAFYGEVLGLERIEKPGASAARGGAWFRSGAVEIHLSIDDEAPDESRVKKRHVCYVVADLAHAERQLRAAGVAILADPDPRPEWPRFYARDPGGNRLEIAAPRAGGAGGATGT